ncbi:MAG: 5'-nucleotidase C-terminal domain-containing protein [Deltaproteobacteria bacterium]|nr:5'-nucleotidase C-terminal domain-containing protein [Deltaproteobacteria bacterium]
MKRTTKHCEALAMLFIYKLKYAALLLAAALLCGCAGISENDSSGAFDSAADAPGAVTFSLLYTTDAHGHIVSGADCIGLDQVAAARAVLPHSLLLDAGDFLHGTTLASVNQGVEIVKLMKQSGYFAAAVGNHEFSHGFAALLAAQAEAAQAGVTRPEAGGKEYASPEQVRPGQAVQAMHLLAANILLPDGSYLFEGSAAKDLNGVKVCVFGLSTPQTPILASPSAVRGLTFQDPVEAARMQTERLRAEGCEFVLALAHLGSDSPSGISSTDVAAALAEAGPLSAPDLIVDGHSHVELEKQVNGVFVVSSGAHGRKLGRLDVVYDLAAKRVLAMRNRLLGPADLSGLAPDAEVAHDIAALEAAQGAWLGEVVAESVVELNGEKRVMRTRETGLGNLCADAIRAVYDTDFALINGGSLRRSLPAGPLTRGDIFELEPFGGSVVSLRVSGRELEEILEHAYAAWPAPDGAFAQVSGLIVRLEPENAPGSRVVEVLDARNGHKLDPERQYTLAVNDFMAEGGDGYPLLADKPRLGQGILLTDAIIDFLRRHDTALYQEGKPSRILW